MNKGNFKKGHIPFNKGKKMTEYISESSLEKIKQTQFKSGQTAAEKSNKWKGGIQEMTNDVVYLYSGVGKRIRRPKYVYEFHNGKIPKGWILYHLDQNKHNDNIDNLIAIPRAVLMKINAGRLNVNYHDIKQEVENYLKLRKSINKDF
jgi:hypothetical protein